MSLATWSAGAIWATAFTSRGGSICRISITPLPPQLRHLARLRFGDGSIKLRWRRVPGEVAQDFEQLAGPLAIHHAVVHLVHHRELPIGQALDEPGLPQRPVAVEMTGVGRSRPSISMRPTVC